MKKIGFFGGSFDPIHFGHLNLAIQILEQAKLDEILFCPAFCSPFKLDKKPVAAPSHRLAMVEKAIAKIPHFRVASLEIDRSDPSFTVDTLRELQAPGVSYRLILSQESAAHFFSWKDPEEILRLAPPIVGARARSEKMDKRLSVLQTSLFDISSTEVRDRLKKKLYCGHLVPAVALDYIAHHRLYS